MSDAAYGDEHREELRKELEELEKKRLVGGVGGVLSSRAEEVNMALGEIEAKVDAGLADLVNDVDRLLTREKGGLNRRSQDKIGQEGDFRAPEPPVGASPASLPVGAAFPSGSDERVVNNVMRHNYRVLSIAEKQAMTMVKDKGLELWELIDRIGKADLLCNAQPGGSRELSLAKTHAEEAIMWSVKHITK